MNLDPANLPHHETVFDVDAEKLARVYAKAALDAAGDQAQSVVEDLAAIRDEVLSAYPQLAKAFDSALISADEKIGLLDRVFGGKIGDVSLNFLRVLAQHGRLGLLGAVVQSARKIWEERSGQVPVDAVFAQPTDDQTVSQLTGRLREVLGREPLVSVSVDEDLIAGFVVRVGDRVFDASAKTNFELARHAMVARAVEAIQAHPEQFHDSAASDA
ncbi:MAG: ATP synthase F1 subunit delta [Planctomycetota bacterium]